MVTDYSVTHSVARLLARASKAFSADSAVAGVALARAAQDEALREYDLPGEALARMHIADGLARSGQDGDALNELREALNMWRTLGHQVGQIRAWSLRLRILWTTTAFDSAGQCIDEIVALSAQAPDDTIPFAKALFRTATDAGHYGVAQFSRTLLRRSLELGLVSKTDPWLIAGMQMNLATVEPDQGLRLTYATEAVQTYERMLPPNSPLLVAPYRVMAGVLYDRGARDRAAEYQFRAYDIASFANPTSIQSAGAAWDLATYYRDTGNADSALAFAERSCEIYRIRAPNSTHLAEALLNYSIMLADFGEGAIIDSLLLESSEIFRKVAPSHPSHGYVLNNLGIRAFQREEIEPARELFSLSSKIARFNGIGDRGDWESSYNLALLEHSAGNVSLALELAETTLVAYERIGEHATSSEELVGLGKDVTRVSYAVVQALIDLNRKQEAWSTLCLQRARAFYWTLGVQDPATMRGSPLYVSYQVALEEAYIAGRALEEARAATLTAERTLNSQITREMIAAGRASRARARLDSIRAVATETATTLPTSRSPFDPSTLDYKSAIVAFMVTDSNTARVVAWRGPRGAEFDFSFLPVGSSYWKLLADTLLAVARDDTIAIVGDTRPVMRCMPLISTYLFPDDVWRILQSKERIVIAPDGPIWDIPFALLAVNEKAKWRWLIDGRALEYSVTLDAVQKANGELGHKANSQALVVGNPAAGRYPLEQDEVSDVLPGAAHEAALIAELYGTDALTDTNATESQVRRKVERALSIHLATHAIVQPLWPMGSGVLLARPQSLTEEGHHREDGILQAWEIADEMSLRARIVVLSGCQTARGATSTGEGVASLQQAFVVAGADNVVASLWSIDDDATSAFMIAFHKSLRKGRSPGAALSMAAETVRKQGYSHPYYWAAFRVLRRSLN